MDNVTVSVSQPRFNRDLIINVTKILLSSEKQNVFGSGSYKVDKFFTWVVSTPSPNEMCEIVKNLVQEKVDRRKSGHALNNLSVTTVHNEDPLVEELGSNQVRQLLRVALAVESYTRKDPRVSTCFFTTFERHGVSVSFVKAGRYMQVVLGGMKKRRRDESSTSPTHLQPASASQVMFFFHALVFVEERIARKRVKARRNHNTGDRIGFVVRTVTSAFSCLSRNAGLGGIYATMAPYILYSTTTGLFRPLAHKADGFAPDSQRLEFKDSDKPLFVPSGVNDEAWSRADDLDIACRHIANMFFSVLETLLLTDAIYTLPESRLSEIPHMAVLDTSGSGLPPLFSTLPDSVIETLDIEKPEATVTVSLVEPSSIPAEPSTTTAKEEDVVDFPVPSGATDLSDTEREAYMLLEDAMSQYVCVYDTSFRELSDIHADRKGEELTGLVDLLLVDPPYNTRREGNKDHSRHDVFTTKDMDDLVDFASDILVPGAHGHIFCSHQQIVEWESRLQSVTTCEDMSDDSDNQSDGEDAITPVTSASKKRRYVFQIDTKPLHYTRAPGNYKNNPMWKKLAHTSVDEYAVHFWKTGSTFSTMLARVDYMAGMETPSSYPGFTNEMNNIGKLPHEEIVFRQQCGDSGRKSMARPEQKNVSWMRDVIRKFTKPGMVVVDCCAGTLAVGKAGLSLPEHRRVILCDVDSDVVRQSMPSLVLVFAKQVLSDASDIVGNDEVVAAAKKYISAIENTETQLRLASAHGPPGFPPYQTLPDYLLRFMSVFHIDKTFYDKLQGIPPHSWPRRYCSLWHGMDRMMLLAHEQCVREVFRADSLIKHDKAGLGLFAGRAFAKGETIGFYYGTLVYMDLDKPRNHHRIIGEGSMAVNRERFNKWGLCVTRGSGVYINRKWYHIWVVPTAACAMSYINDPRYLEDENVPLPQRTRTSNLEFIQNCATFRAQDVSSHTMMCLKAKRDIKAGEEFYVDYGTDYDM